MVQRSHWSGRLILPGTLAALSLSVFPEFGASPAQAQAWWSDQPSSYSTRPRARVSRPKVPRRDATRVAGLPKQKAEEIEAAKATAGGPLLAIVTLSSQRLTVYDSTGPVIHSAIASGKPTNPTPIGVFSIIQKNRHHRSNIYSGAPMPFMQRITWSGIAMHAGVLPGYPASHGCIRLPYPVAAKLFAMSKMGMRVVVARSEAQVSAFTHAALPEPLMVATPAPPRQAPRADGDTPTATPVAIRVAAAEGAGHDGKPEGGQPIATRFLNPMQNAQLERVRSRERVTESIRANKDLLEASLRASADANAAAAVLRAAQAAYDALQARQPTDAQLAEAARILEEAKATEATRNKAAFAAASASRDAEDAQAKAEQDVKIAERGTEAIAVFVSRKEGKVFVRQGMVPLFDAPVSFKEPGRPLGTHVYQAMSADDATGRIGWKPGQ